MKLTNAHRSRNGRAALTLDTAVGSDQPYLLPIQTFLFQLNQSTQQWAEQLAQSCKFYHRPKPWPRKARGENIAKNGSPTAERFINQWIKSPGHNRNVCCFIILCSYSVNCFSHIHFSDAWKWPKHNGHWNGPTLHYGASP